MGAWWRLWNAPLWAHVAALGTLLAVLVPVVGTATSFSPDEGAAVIQARSLARGGGWAVEHPFAGIDPDDRFYPLAAAAPGTDGIAPFAKHPVYPVVLAGLERVGGAPATVGLSVLGTLAAAGLAALVAREVTGGLERPALWAVGLGSPLLFDAYLLIGHALGAALATASVLFALKALHRPRGPSPVGASVAAAAGCAAGAVLLRSEALILAVALGASIALTGLVRRQVTVVAGALAVPLAGLAAALAEQQLQVAAIGADPGGVRPPAVTGGVLEARIEGFLNTWLRPTSGSVSSGDLGLLLVVLLVATAGVVARHRPDRHRPLVALVIAAVGFSAWAWMVDVDRVVPGLLAAFPLAVVAIALVDRRVVAADGHLVLSATAGLFMAGTLATQYREGGSAEWGGRYFALAVPLVAVLAVDALARLAPRLPSVSRRWAAAGLVTCSLLLALGALASLRHVHEATGRLLQRIATTAASTVPGDARAEPVILSAYPNLPRLAWPTYDRQRWLHNPDDDLGGDLAARLRQAGVRELVFIGQEPDDTEPYLEDYAVDGTRSWETERWRVSVLVARE